MILIMFGQLKDQKNARTIIENFISSRRFPHSFLFYGPKGVGKMLMAKSIVKYFNCKNTDERLKGNDNCSICQRIENEIYPDFSIIRTEKIVKKSGDVKESKMIKVNQIKEIVKQIQYKPFEGSYKFFIIDGAEMMNNISENSFLKTLEEPLPNNYIILISHNINKILPTILSRCIKIKFEGLKQDTLKDIIKKEFELDDALSLKISMLANGSMNCAKILIENDMYKEIFQIIEDVIECISSEVINVNKIFAISQIINKLDIQYIDYIFDLLLLYLHGSYLMSVHEIDKINFFKYYLNFKTKSGKLFFYNNIIKEVIKTKYYLLNTNVDIKLLVENLIVLIRENIL